MKEFILKLLDSRETRSKRQNDLIKKYQKPIISYMLNIPGIEKKNQNFERFHNFGFELIKKKLGDKILDFEYYGEDTGMYYLISVDMNPMDLKILTVDLENKDSGRLFDIDVFDENYNQITRSKLGLNPRKCLICKKNAKDCSRNQTHSYEDLLIEVNKLINLSYSID